MKKLVFGLIATVFMFNFSLGQIKSSDFGKIHNELVTAYLNKNKDLNLNNVKMIDVVNEFIKNFESKYPNTITENDKKEIMEIFKNYSYALDFSYSEFLTKNKESLLKNGRISKNIYDFLVITNTENINFDAIKNEISKFQNMNNLLKSDVFAFEVANSIAISSNELWNTNNSHTQRRVNHCNGRIIISDTGAALCFLGAGPVSLIAGGLSSLITAYSDGHCR